jgi:hypothetical protein
MVVIRLKTAKSFRFNEEDIKKLEVVHKYYKDNYEERVKQSHMDNLHKWSYAQTLAVLIRDKYEEIKDKVVVKK